MHWELVDTLWVSINSEAFMAILEWIWERWTTKDQLVNAVRRVGINNDTIGVEFMQQDMFKGTPGSASI